MTVTVTVTVPGKSTVAVDRPPRAVAEHRSGPAASARCPRPPSG
jgi:hypothetical protein